LLEENQRYQAHIETLTKQNQQLEGRQQTHLEGLANRPGTLELTCDFPPVMQIADRYEKLMKNTRVELVYGQKQESKLSREEIAKRIWSKILDCNRQVLNSLEEYKVQLAKPPALPFCDNSTQKPRSLAPRVWDAVVAQLRYSHSHLDNMENKKNIIHGLPIKESFIKELLKEFSTKQGDPIPFIFFRDLLRLCWEMALCNPPVQLGQERTHDWFEADQTTSFPQQDQLLYPCLLYEGRLLKKGAVWIRQS